MIIHILIGLPGSGKTTWLNKHANSHATFDDISQTDPKLEKLHHFLQTTQEDSMWIADVNFANLHTFQAALQKYLIFVKQNLSLIFVLFPKDKEDCLMNVRLRNDGRWVEPTIHRFSSIIDNVFSYIKTTYPDNYMIGSTDFNKRKSKPS